MNTIGIYYWNGATWVKASLPSTSAADSGKFLMSNGSGWVTSIRYQASYNDTLTFHTMATSRPVAWNAVLDTSAVITFVANQYTAINAIGISMGDVCITKNSDRLPLLWAQNGKILFVPLQGNSGNISYTIRCFRPSY